MVDSRPSLLYLCHRIPYPPNKGDKVRSWNWLRRLSIDFRVHLAAFVDVEDDWQHEGVLREHCEDVMLRPLKPLPARIKSLGALACGEPLTTRYFHDARMHAWVRSVVARGGARHVLLFSSGMLPYLVHCDARCAVLDFCDVDSVKWAQYAATAHQPMRWLYAREARTLGAAEARAAAAARATTFVSQPEAALFIEQVGHGSAAGARVAVVGNGVDTEYFDPLLDYEDVLPGGAPLAVFTGAMDYQPNVDAACWFARDIWPDVRAEVPEARFAVVGARPAESVRSLRDCEGVIVTGTVPDVRPWLARARLAVAPLRVARGIQNKVLEAMAMGLEVVATEAAAEGIEAGHGIAVCTGDSMPQQIARTVMARLGGAPLAGEDDARREFIRQHYDWNAAAARLRELLGSNAVAEVPAVTAGQQFAAAG